MAVLLLVLGACSSRTVQNPGVSPMRNDASVDAPAGGSDGGGPRPGGRPVVGPCLERPVTGKANGLACGCHDECTSGTCVDGVCCNTACTGTCQACNIPGHAGTCAPLPDNSFPVVEGQCVAEPAASCGLDGRCDGRGACRRHRDGTICVAGRCEGNQVVGAMACSAGLCRDAGTQTCAPYGCDPASNACHPRCISDAECAGVACQAGSCGQKPLGAVCEMGTECESGVCADGVCCNIACTGPCVSCRELGKAGRCAPVPAGNADPHGVCVAEDPMTCGRNGMCNGQGGCSRYPVGSICRPASCTDATRNPASVCDEDGSCAPGASFTCAPFLCAAGACRGGCDNDADCLAPNACVAGSCGPKGPGQPCKAGSECASTFCVDGVCCNDQCEGQCRSCALPNTPGTCTDVPAGVPDPRAAAGETDPARICVDQGAGSCGSNGLCNGQGGCQRYEDGTVCQAASCDVASNRAVLGTCNEGTCRVTSRGCAPHLCNGDSCGFRCDDNTQCAPPNVCQDGSCGKRPDGEPCSENRPDECASGICAQGICCKTDCKGACMSCALPQSMGICAAVPAGQPDPQRVCVDGKPASCGTDGRCDGAGGCRKYPAGALCSPPICREGTTMRASFCTADGTCPAPQTEVCTPIIVCNAAGNACEKTCTRDNQCMPGTKCFGGKCGLLDDGRACDMNNDCKSSNCVDGVCCNSACGGTVKGDCQACSQKEGASKDGVCTVRTGQTCNDGNACTKVDTCVASPMAPGAVCTGSMPVVCSAASQCHVAGVCDPRTGTCSNPFKPETAECTDMNACTTGDHCDGKGKCLPGGPKCMGAVAPCHELCNRTTGECHAALPNDTPCNDMNACTRGDRCMGGVCAKFTSVETCANACAVCNPGTGTCTGAAKPDGAPCDDGNKCMTGDQCMGGVCRPGATMVTCGANTCKLCNPQTGTCTGANKPNNTPCDDANVCTMNTVCRGGNCGNGTAVACPTPRCQRCHPTMGCIPDRVGMECNDGLRCTGNEICSATGQCTVEPKCKLPCQTCDEATGNCSPLTCPAPGLPVPASVTP